VLLQNYPNVSQLSAKINPYFDCVPTSIVEGVEYLTGQHIDIDAMVTACYGANYHGATSAARYVEYCAAHGVHLYPIDGAPALLVADLHTLIQESKPCLLTEPDVYAPAHPDWSHVLSVYGETPGVLIARDPYSTKDVAHDDALWAKLLEYREIWVMEAISMQLSIDMPQVAALFEQHDENHWTDKATGRPLSFGLLADYKASGAASLERLGHVQSPEIVLANGDVAQYYEFGARLWHKATGKVESLNLFAPGPGLPALQPPQVAPAMPQIAASALQAAEELAAALGKKLV
jgi:hypothetical protein